jgi:hypothetical protein
MAADPVGPDQHDGPHAVLGGGVHLFGRGGGLLRLDRLGGLGLDRGGHGRRGPLTVEGGRELVAVRAHLVARPLGRGARRLAQAFEEGAPGRLDAVRVPPEPLEEVVDIGGVAAVKERGLLEDLPQMPAVVRHGFQHKRPTPAPGGTDREAVRVGKVRSTL